ncbi:hypothetical protein DF268_30215 [Streptomyces sp. V2]|nr:hypothetical protein DF268_30215 [Streptomyces sp. V2]
MCIRAAGVGGAAEASGCGFGGWLGWVRWLGAGPVGGWGGGVVACPRLRGAAAPTRAAPSGTTARS